MNGLLIHHSSKYIDVLESGYLKSKYQIVKDNPSLFEDEEDKFYYGYSGPYDNPLIFSQLVFEDKIIPMSGIRSGTFFLDPLLIRDYGEQKLNKKDYKLFKDEKSPLNKAWFNTDWCSGSYKLNEGCNTVGYDPKLTLEDNIFLFNQAKRLSMINQKLKYDTVNYTFKHKNEVVIFEKKIKLEDYLLGVYLEDIDMDSKLKEKFPEYNIMNKNESRRFIKEYFKN